MTRAELLLKPITLHPPFYHPPCCLAKRRRYPIAIHATAVHHLCFTSFRRPLSWISMYRLLVGTPLPPPRPSSSHVHTHLSLVTSIAFLPPICISLLVNHCFVMRWTSDGGKLAASTRARFSRGIHQASSIAYSGPLFCSTLRNIGVPHGPHHVHPRSPILGAGIRQLSVVVRGLVVMS